MNRPRDIRTILFVSFQNAVRSPMAEGFVNHLVPSRYRAAGAGIEPREIDPLTVQVMKEAGVDLSSYQNLRAGRVSDTATDFLVTLSDRAMKLCPLFPNAQINFHKGFPDPSQTPGTEKERLEAFRKTRDHIREWVEKTFG